MSDRVILLISRKSRNCGMCQTCHYPVHGRHVVDLTRLFVYKSLPALQIVIRDINNILTSNFIYTELYKADR